MADIVTDNEQALFEECAMLKKKVEKLKRDVAEARPYVKFERGTVAIGGAFVLATTLLGSLAWSLALAPPEPPPPPNEISFCYPTNYDGKFVLHGNRRRSGDVDISKHDTMPELIETAQKLGCPLLREKR